MTGRFLHPAWILVAAIAFPLGAVEVETWPGIENPRALEAWSAALRGLSQASGTRAVACHFGDSHLQVGQVDAEIRRGLQTRYGHAGRGYVFPYEAAATSNPPDLASASDGDWRLHRMMGASSGYPVGPGGLAAHCESPEMVLGLSVRSEEDAFDRVRVLYAPGRDRSELWVATAAEALREMRALRRAQGVRGVAEEELPRLQGLTIWGVLDGNDSDARTGPVVDLGSPSKDVFLLGVRGKERQKRTELLGLLLERRDRSGVLWHSLAANGAEARHFLEQEHLRDQVRAMEPQLLVVSLGTNETQQRHFDAERALDQQRRLWRRLRSAAPRAALLVCGPPDASLGGDKTAERLDAFIEGLRRLAPEEGAAFIDIRSAQGGAGSYRRWAAAGLAGKDGVHYRNAGYQKMGAWILNALLSVEAAHAVP